MLNRFLVFLKALEVNERVFTNISPDAGGDYRIRICFLIPTQEVTTAFVSVFFSPDAGGDYCIRTCFLVPTQEVTTAFVSVLTF